MDVIDVSNEPWVDAEIRAVLEADLLAKCREYEETIIRNAETLEKLRELLKLWQP